MADNTNTTAVSTNNEVRILDEHSCNLSYWNGPYGLYVEDFPENYQLPFDPTITTTADGQYRLFFTTHVLGMEEPFVYGTALSDDGLHYTYDGIAFARDQYDIVNGSEVRVGDNTFVIIYLEPNTLKLPEDSTVDKR